jgi:hypothetical protein
MLHLKRADINWQMQWFSRISETIAENPKLNPHLTDYYNPDREKILRYHSDVSVRPRLSGIENWYRDAHHAKFMDSITYLPKEDIYQGSYGQELVLCEIPDEWKVIL